ncbi:MAG: ESX-1 secretion-associated protein [Mycobacterium sp.]
MTEHLDVAPEELRSAAGYHRGTAEYLRAVPADNAGIMASLESLGPVFAELRDAGRELLDQRRACYQQQAAEHEALADRLEWAAAVWEHHDTDGATRLRGVSEERK